MPVDLASEIRRSDLIFVGTVIEVGNDRVTFHVAELYKGQTGIRVSSQMDPMRFYVDSAAVGQRFVIFMRQTSPNQFVVNDCGSSQSGAEVPRIVRALRAAGLRSHPPTPPPPPG